MPLRKCCSRWGLGEAALPLTQISYQNPGDLASECSFTRCASSPPASSGAVESDGAGEPEAGANGRGVQSEAEADSRGERSPGQRGTPAFPTPCEAEQSRLKFSAAPALSFDFVVEWCAALNLGSLIVLKSQRFVIVDRRSLRSVMWCSMNLGVSLNVARMPAAASCLFPLPTLTSPPISLPSESYSFHALWGAYLRNIMWCFQTVEI